MTQRVLLVFAAVAALALGGGLAFVPAEEAPAKPPLTLTPPSEPEVPESSGREDMEAGRSLVERGAELFLRGLMDEMEPQLDEMQKGLGAAAEQLGPKLKEILALIDDVRNYQAPERLPNGDILIRRVPGAPQPPSLTAPDDRAPKGPVTDL